MSMFKVDTNETIQFEKCKTFLDYQTTHKLHNFHTETSVGPNSNIYLKVVHFSISFKDICGNLRQLFYIIGCLICDILYPYTNVRFCFLSHAPEKKLIPRTSNEWITTQANTKASLLLPLLSQKDLETEVKHAKVRSKIYSINFRKFSLINI